MKRKRVGIIKRDLNRGERYTQEQVTLPDEPSAIRLRVAAEPPQHLISNAPVAVVAAQATDLSVHCAKPT